MTLTVPIFLMGSFCALLLGVSKTGVPGVGMFAALLMIMIFPGHEMFAAGAVVPLLVVGDVAGVWYYWRDASWKLLWRLFAPLAIGLVVGMTLMCFMSNGQFRLAVGVLVTSILCFEFVRQRVGWVSIIRNRLFGYACGFLAGLTTMLGNAAGPVLAAYFASQKLSKDHFMGTHATLCLVMNTTKIPLLLIASAVKVSMHGSAADVQIITPMTFVLTAAFLPGLIVGTLIGRRLFFLIPERYFVPLILCLNFLAALQILISAILAS